jgi:type I restriction enzyme S subunit
MNAERLLAHFDRLAEAPDAVPRLRRFVLDLAVRGKLVEEDSKDEPVSELLLRIRAQKIRQGGSKAPNGTGIPASGDSKIGPFKIPTRWAWLPLNDVGQLSGGMTPSKSRSDYWDGDVNWFSPKDVKSDELVDSELKISSVAVADTGLQVYPPGCLFMVARSGILKRTFPVSINRVMATANQDLKVLRPFVNGAERYIQIALRGMTDFILSRFVKTGTTVQSLK